MDLLDRPGGSRVTCRAAQWLEQQAAHVTGCLRCKQEGEAGEVAVMFPLCCHWTLSLNMWQQLVAARAGRCEAGAILSLGGDEDGAWRAPRSGERHGDAVSAPTQQTLRLSANTHPETSCNCQHTQCHSFQSTVKYYHTEDTVQGQKYVDARGLHTYVMGD